MIKAYTIKEGKLIEMSGSDVSPAGVSARKAIQKAIEAVKDGATTDQVKDWALKKAKIALVEWPTPTEGKKRVEYYRLNTEDLSDMPEPRMTIGPAVFAYEEVDLPPKPVPSKISSRQFIEWLTVSGKISIAQLVAWHTNGTIPPPIIQGLTAYSGTNAEKARWLNKFVKEVEFYRRDEKGDFISILKSVFNMTDAELDIAFFEAEVL